MYLILGLILFGIFIALPSLLFRKVVEWAGTNGWHKPLAALFCLALGLGEGYVGYWLFVGFEAGSVYEDGVLYQEVFRMRIPGVGAMLMGGFLTIIGPFACLAPQQPTTRRRR